MIDEDLQSEIAGPITSNIPHLFISSVAGQEHHAPQGHDLGTTQCARLMFEVVHSFDVDAMYVLNHWLPASTDTFWLVVTKTHHLDSPLRGHAGAIVQTLGDGHIYQAIGLSGSRVLLWDQGAIS
jgi:hypothetical protein